MPYTRFFLQVSCLKITALNFKKFLQLLKVYVPTVKILFTKKKDSVFTQTTFKNSKEDFKSEKKVFLVLVLLPFSEREVFFKKLKQLLLLLPQGFVVKMFT